MTTVRPACAFRPVRRWPVGSRTVCRGPMPTRIWRSPPALPPGLHGIENELEPSEPIQGEFEVPDNLSLPCTLHAALERLKRSQLAKELFGTEFIEGYIASKTLELTSFFDEITPWERRVLAAQA